MAKKKPAPEEEEVVKNNEGLLREEYFVLNNEIETLFKEISDMQNELWLAEQSIREQKIKNNVYSSYSEKKNSKRLKNTITLKDYYLFNLNELKRERDEMLAMYARIKDELQDVLLQEKNLLEQTKKELESTADIQLIRQTQEAEIKRLEQEIKNARNCQSIKLQELKDISTERQMELEKEAKIILDGVTKESQKILNKLVVEYVNKICKENGELHKDVLKKLELIKAMEIEKSNLEKQNELIRRKQMFAYDLGYAEHKRREGLAQIIS
ncbi:unnamed protein product [Schistosoma turkestanicum]|nr:unnamed protein product [Schistosoma turkestanicum]